MTLPILRTKLYAPPVRAGMVARSRLGDRLDAGLWARPDGGRPEFARKLTLVAAPAMVRPAPGEPADRGQAGLALELEPLSEREVEILNLVAAGLSNQEIGQKLFIGVGTVKWYLNNLYGKLDVRSRTQAVARARGLGLVA